MLHGETTYMELKKKKTTTINTLGTPNIVVKQFTPLVGWNSIYWVVGVQGDWGEVWDTRDNSGKTT